MPFRLLPIHKAKTSPSDISLKLLILFTDSFRQNSRASLDYLLEFLREHLADGCAIAMFSIDDGANETNKIGLSPTFPKSIVGYIKSLLQSNPALAEEDLLVYDCGASVSYLMVKLDPPLDFQGDRLILWKHGELFNSSDCQLLEMLFNIISFKMATESHNPRQRRYSINGDNSIKVEENPNVLQQALDAVPDIILFCDYEGHILSMNRAATDILSKVLEEIDQKEGSRSWIAAACHPDDVKDLFNTWTEAAYASAPRKLRCRIMTDHCRYRKLLCRFVPIGGSDGNQSGVRWIFIGTSIQPEEEDTDSLSKIKVQFVAEISHEIRTPLACIIGTSTLLSHTNLDGEQAELVRTIAISSQQLTSLVNNVIDMNRIAENELIIERNPVDLENLINETIELFRSDFIQKNLDSIIEISQSVPKEVVSDELRIRQVLTNLLSNAIKFTNNETVITVSSQIVAAGNGKNYIRISVQDQGRGIADADGKKLFEVFRQLSFQGEKRQGGSGLGLAICKKLMALLGGYIGYSSVLGKGSIFYFDLPLELCHKTSNRIAGGTSKKETNVDSREALERCISETTNKFVRVGIKMKHSQLSESIKRFLGSSSHRLLPLILEDKNHIQQNCEIFVTDIQDYALKAASTKKGVIFLSYESTVINTNCSKMDLVEQVKKPLRSTLMVCALKQLLQKLYCKQVFPVEEPKKRPPEEKFAEKYPLRILVAEDDELNQKLLGRVLCKFGYTNVEFAMTGKEAVDKVFEFSKSSVDRGIDVIFMDMQMPELDGCGAAKQIRENRFKCHIIAMTANAFSEDRIACMQSGMCDYVAKPVKWDILKSLLMKSFEVISGKVSCACSRL